MDKTHGANQQDAFKALECQIRQVEEDRLEAVQRLAAAEDAAWKWRTLAGGAVIGAFVILMKLAFVTLYPSSDDRAFACEMRELTLQTEKAAVEVASETARASCEELVAAIIDWLSEQKPCDAKPKPTPSTNATFESHPVDSRFGYLHLVDGWPQP